MAWLCSMMFKFWNHAFVPLAVALTSHQRIKMDLCKSPCLFHSLKYSLFVPSSGSGLLSSGKTKQNITKNLTPVLYINIVKKNNMFLKVRRRNTRCASRSPFMMLVIEIQFSIYILTTFIQNLHRFT